METLIIRNVTTEQSIAPIIKYISEFDFSGAEDLVTRRKSAAFPARTEYGDFKDYSTKNYAFFLTVGGKLELRDVEYTHNGTTIHNIDNFFEGLKCADFNLLLIAFNSFIRHINVDIIEKEIQIKNALESIKE